MIVSPRVFHLRILKKGLLYGVRISVMPLSPLEFSKVVLLIVLLFSQEPDQNCMYIQHLPSSLDRGRIVIPSAKIECFGMGIWNELRIDAFGNYRYREGYRV